MIIFVKARVYPTENEKKVKKSIKNLLDIDLKKEGSYIIGKDTQKKSLEKIYLLLRSQGIITSARKLFLKKVTGNNLNFELNKQAAYVGAVNLAGNSYLGAIHITIKSPDIISLIDWMAPDVGEGKN
jgi:predicted RNA binding protein with dsRBD fold (UPF0201 family)|tara:strand:- start:5891 stop:6271 length:381 start_codon:yes stop_codon:yes gene_type:complete